MMFIRRHLTAILGISLAVVAVAIAGISFGVTRAEYDDYLTEYNKGIDDLKAKQAALPEAVFINDDYFEYSDDGLEVSSAVSTYPKGYIMYAGDAAVSPLNANRAEEIKLIPDDDTPLGKYITSLDRSGGAITFSFDTEKNGMSDICLVIRTNWKNNAGEYVAYDNITDYIKIHMNKLEVKTTEVELSDDHEFHQLVLKNTYLIQGTNTLTITTDAYNPYHDNEQSNTILYIMPDIRNVAVMSEVDITVNKPNRS